jgi:archaemetzincin
VDARRHPGDVACTLTRMGPRRRQLLRWGALAVAAGQAQLGHAAPQPPVVYLQPLGSALPEADVALVERALRVLIGAEVRRLERVDLPATAFYAPRARYRADKLLGFLNARRPAGSGRILGLTAADISTTKGAFADWGVIGLGELPGTASVISIYRCRRRARDAAQARARLAKAAVHELGHTLGLNHCPTRGCLMQDAEGQVATADGEYDFCAACRARLVAAGRGLPVDPAIPWPRPAGG